MELSAAGLKEQPFRTHGKPLSVVCYASHLDALSALRDTHGAPNGLALLQGPALSGKSTIIREFVDTLPESCAVAVADGAGRNTTGLLESVLRQFGYELDINSANELLAMVRVFALQQTASLHAPVIVVENAHALNPSALRALCELAELQVRQESALKIVLASDRSLRPIVEAPAMEPIALRLTADIHLEPMSPEEVADYVHTKVGAAGHDDPEAVFPESVCQALWEASGGWPGVLDRVCLLALAKTEGLPVSESVVEHPALPDAELAAAVLESAEDAPTLIVTQGGEIRQRIKFDGSRLLVGRSEHNDMTIVSRFVSRHHMLMVRHGTTTFLMDLNSTNGTFVNSRRVSNHVLIDSDVISVGNHRIKFCDPRATVRHPLESAELADTVIMKSLDDVRSLLARENTELLPIPVENLPTRGS